MRSSVTYVIRKVWTFIMIEKTLRMAIQHSFEQKFDATNFQFDEWTQRPFPLVTSSTHSDKAWNCSWFLHRVVWKVVIYRIQVSICPSCNYSIFKGDDQFLTRSSPDGDLIVHDFCTWYAYIKLICWLWAVSHRLSLSLSL